MSLLVEEAKQVLGKLPKGPVTSCERGIYVGNRLLATVSPDLDTETAEALSGLIALFPALVVAAPSVTLRALDEEIAENEHLREALDTLEKRQSSFREMVVDTLKSL